MSTNQLVVALRARLLNRRGQFKDIAALSGLSISWISKFANGHRDNPTFETAAKLTAALDQLDAKREAA